MPDFGAGGLFGGRLDLMASRERGRDSIEGDVYGRGEPKGEKLNEEGTDYLDKVRVVSCDDSVPPCRELGLKIVKGLRFEICIHVCLGRWRLCDDSEDSLGINYWPFSTIFIFYL